MNFYRNWKEYEDGFGDLSGEFWWGNKNLRRFTEDGKQHSLGSRHFRLPMAMTLKMTSAGPACLQTKITRRKGVNFDSHCGPLVKIRVGPTCVG